MQIKPVLASIAPLTVKYRLEYHPIILPCTYALVCFCGAKLRKENVQLIQAITYILNSNFCSNNSNVVEVSLSITDFPRVSRDSEYCHILYATNIPGYVEYVYCWFRRYSVEFLRDTQPVLFRFVYIGLFTFQIDNTWHIFTSNYIFLKHNFSWVSISQPSLDFLFVPTHVHISMYNII